MASSLDNPSELELTEFARRVPSLSVSCVQSRMFHVWKHFQSKRVDLSKPCSGSHAAGCWILERLTLFNRILYLVDIQLVEHQPGELVLCRCNSTSEFCSEDAVLDSTFLICWLLKHHPCIRAIDIVETSLFSHFPSVLKLALSLASTVKSVKVGTRGATLQHSVFLSELPRWASTLEHFEVSGLQLDRDATTRLADALGRASCLKSVVFSNNTLSGSGRNAIYKSLQNCTELTSLKIYDCGLNERSARHLALAIGRAKSLKDLTLLNIPEVPLAIIVKAITTETRLKNLTMVCRSSNSLLAEAVAALLRTNRSIETLKLKDVRLVEDRVRVLAEALQVNEHLQKLNLRDSNLDDQGVAPLAGALTQNRTLAELDLRDNVLTHACLLPFLKALSTNYSLKLVRFGVVDFPEDDGEEFLNATRNLPFYHRIGVSWNGPVLRKLAHIIERDEDIEKVHLEWEEAVPGIKLLLRAIRVNTHVTELHLGAHVTPDLETARAIASVLEASRSLRTIKYYSFSVENFFDESLVVATVLSGLKNSKSIIAIKFSVVSFDLVVANALSAVLEANTTLNSFAVKRAFVEKGAYKLLAKHLRNNYTLLNFEVKDHQGCTSEFFGVLEVMRRNQLFLNRAVRFVVDTCRDADCREAFRVLHKSDSLVQQLSTATGTSWADARLQVEAAVPLVSFKGC